MSDLSPPKSTRADAGKRHTRAPGPDDACHAFSKAVFAPGAPDARTKRLTAVVVAHVMHGPWCVEGHVKATHREGATGKAIRLTAEMQAQAVFAHAIKALELIGDNPSDATS